MLSKSERASDNGEGGVPDPFAGPSAEPGNHKEESQTRPAFSRISKVPRERPIAKENGPASGIRSHPLAVAGWVKPAGPRRQAAITGLLNCRPNVYRMPNRE